MSDRPNERRSSRPSSPTPSDRPSATVLDGLAGSPGVAIGPALVVDNERPGVVRRHIPKHLADEEMGRFDAAVALASLGLKEVAERLRTTAGRAESSILEAYIMMVEDEGLRQDVERRIRIDRQCAEWALDCAIRELSVQMGSADDPYLAERSHDFEFVGDRILRALTGRQHALSLPDIGQRAIVVAHDLSPAETAGLSKERVCALVTEVGTRTSHTAILARALEIPAVVGVRGILAHVGNGDHMVVDGLRGRVILAPTDEMIHAASARSSRYLAMALGLRELRDRPAATKCGVPIVLRANIELPNESQIALEQGAQGIGLYRTEFLYVDRAEPPTEEEQYETYCRVLRTMAPLPVTLRTFDIGGDKFVSSFQAPPEMNPALGLRAVRLGLARPEIFLQQLRAMLRASVHGSLRIMVPMISAVRELRAVRELFQQAERQVDAAGQPRARHTPLGIMIEVPAAAIMAQVLAREAEFLSIGTNDLVQYSLAVDRSSNELAYLASHFDPAILRLVRSVVQAGEHHGRAVGVCGAMASEPLAAVLLVGMGLRELSMESSAIPGVKEAIARITVAEAEAAAQAAFRCVTAEEVVECLTQAVGARIADLLDADDLL